MLKMMGVGNLAALVVKKRTPMDGNPVLSTMKALTEEAMTTARSRMWGIPEKTTSLRLQMNQTERIRRMTSIGSPEKRPLANRRARQSPRSFRRYLLATCWVTLTRQMLNERLKYPTPRRTGEVRGLVARASYRMGLWWHH